MKKRYWVMFEFELGDEFNFDASYASDWCYQQLEKTFSGKAEVQRTPTTSRLIEAICVQHRND